MKWNGIEIEKRRIVERRRAGAGEHFKCTARQVRVVEQETTRSQIGLCSPK